MVADAASRRGPVTDFGLRGDAPVARGLDLDPFGEVIAGYRPFRKQKGDAQRRSGRSGAEDDRTKG